MNVKELKHLIESLPDEMEIILQKDAEGNGYSPLYDGDSDAVYISCNNWSGNVYGMQWSAADACKSEDEWKEIKTKPRVLILHPIN